MSKGTQGTDEAVPTVRIACSDCPYAEVVEQIGEEPARTIIEHGRETGHKLSIEDRDDD